MKRNIVFFIPSIEGGGVEKNFFLLIKFLIKKFNKIYVISAHKKIFKKNKKIIQISPSSKFFYNRGRLIKTIICLCLLVKNFIYKDTIVFSFQSNVPVIILSKILGFKVLIRLNTSLKKYIDNFLKKFFFKTIYSFSDKIVVNSREFQKELKKININSILIYNLMKPEKVKKDLKFFKRYKGLKILNIGRLTSQKDQITLIKSLNILKLKKIDFRCCIIGKGILMKYLRNNISKYQLSRNVILLGYKKNAENYIHNCNLFVLTSKYEGLPNVLIEAQKFNVPIISSNCPTGPKEILLNGKLGDLFKVGNYKDLARKVTSFNFEKTKLKKKSLLAKNYLFRFDPFINSSQYEKLINKI